MKYLKKLFCSLSEIFLVIIFQYIILIGTILIFGFDKSILIGTFFIMLFELIYVIFRVRNFKISFKLNNYLPYILLGTSISCAYNMIIFKFGIKFDMNNNVPLFINLLASAIVGPIFEEILFRYVFIDKLKKFNSGYLTIIISSIVFGICHNNVITIIYAFIIGIINSCLYIKKDDIMVPIIIHMSSNFLSTFLFNYNPIILCLSGILFFISILIIKK